MENEKSMTSETSEKFIAERLKEIRERSRVSARQMSIALEQNPGYINNIEQGKSLPTMARFFAICRFLDITPSRFFKPLETDRDKKRAELV